jgi:chromosome segregation ATPase
MTTTITSEALDALKALVANNAQSSYASSADGWGAYEAAVLNAAPALIERLTKAEAERDAARATLAAARAMLDATGAALADATKRTTAAEAERDAAIATLARVRAEALEEAAQIADNHRDAWEAKRARSKIARALREARDYDTMKIASIHIGAAIRALEPKL